VTWPFVRPAPLVNSSKIPKIDCRTMHLLFTYRIALCVNFVHTEGLTGCRTQSALGGALLQLDQTWGY
jgi:hypothetical protein